MEGGREGERKGEREGGGGVEGNSRRGEELERSGRIGDTAHYGQGKGREKGEGWWYIREHLKFLVKGKVHHIGRNRLCISDCVVFSQRSWRQTSSWQRR